MTLTEFLLARIAEDEAAVQQVVDHGRWTTEEDSERLEWWVTSDLMGSIASTGYVGNNDAHPLAQHIATWDPARVLAECEAKRGLIERHNYSPTCRCLRYLALPHATHPDYQREWRP